MSALTWLKHHFYSSREIFYVKTCKVSGRMSSTRARILKGWLLRGWEVCYREKEQELAPWLWLNQYSCNSPLQEACGVQAVHGGSRRSPVKKTILLHHNFLLRLGEDDLMNPLAGWATKGVCPGLRRACRMPMKGTPKKMRLLKQAQRRMSSTRARTLKGWLLRGGPANEKKNKKWLPEWLNQHSCISPLQEASGVQAVHGGSRRSRVKKTLLLDYKIVAETWWG